MQRIIEAYRQGDITLKAIARAVKVEPSAIYSRFRDPKKRNEDGSTIEDWESLERYLRLRMNIIDYPQSMRSLLQHALEKEEELRQEDRRCGGQKKAAIVIDGKKYPQRKFKGYELYDPATGYPKDELFVAFRDDPKVYQIVMQTKTHTVMHAIDEYGNRLNELLLCYSNATINSKGLGEREMQSKITQYIKFRG